MSKRRIFDIDFPSAPGEAAPPAGTGEAALPAGTGAGTERRGPMAAAIGENADALRARLEAETAIRAENDSLAQEFVRLKGLGLIVDLLPLGAIRARKLTRDRTAERDEEIDELKTSIRAIGLSNPIRVEEADGGYELIQGYRRLLAYRELLAETGDEDRYGRIPASLVARGETLESLYRRMVDENLVRRDISFAEMARLALAYLADPQTGAEDIDGAIATLFGSAGRQKRIYIRNFASLLDRLGPDLCHAEAMPRALGLALLRRLEREPRALADLRRHLLAAPQRSGEEEIALLRRFAAEAETPATAAPPRLPGARTVLRVDRGREVARVTATDGRVEIRMSRDFAVLPRGRLEQAVAAFLATLDAEPDDP